MTTHSNLWASASSKLSEEDRRCINFDGQDKISILTGLQSLTNTAKSEAINNRWRIRRARRGGETETVVIHDLFRKIAVWIDRFKGTGDIVVQYDPVHAALPWAGVRFLLEIAVSDIKKFDFVVEGAETIARSTSRSAIIERLYLRPDKMNTESVKALVDALIRLYATIFVYLAKAKQYFEQSKAKRVLKALVKPQEEFEELLRKVTFEESNVDRYADLVDAQDTNDISNSLQELSIDQGEKHTELLKLLKSIDGPICRMNYSLQAIEDHLDRSERIKILAWLSSQPYLGHHQQVKKQALEGSGQWLLQDPTYIEWYQSSISSLLWLHGKPGSGKSTLVSIVIEDALGRSQAGISPLPVYFYCSRSAAEPERSNPDSVLGSILRQLSCVKPGMALLPPVVKKYREQGEGFNPNIIPLEESLKLLIELNEIHGMTIIIVDALDECNPETRQSLLDAFEDLMRESAGLVKIFVSSRDDQDIVCTLREYPSLNISSDKNQADIAYFVEQETNKLVDKRKLLRNSSAKEEMQELIIGEVSKGADGMFRWASLQLEVLCTLKLDKDIRTRLGSLPPKLEQLYLEVYDDLGSYQGDTGRALIDNVLKWLLCAQRTLRATEFLWAATVNVDIALEDVTKDHVLDLCRNLVLYDEGLDVFRFAHLSVREFLEKRPEFYEMPCNLLAGEICLLQMFASSNYAGPSPAQSDERIARIRRRLASSKESVPNHFLLYARSQWMEHCKSGPRNARFDGTGFGHRLRQFLSEANGPGSAFAAWVHWYCSRFLHDDATAAARRLQDLLISYSDSSSRSFFVAIVCGLREIVVARVRDQLFGSEQIDKGIVLAAMASQHDTLDLLMGDDETRGLTELALSYAIQHVDDQRFTWLLDKGRDVGFTTRILAAVGETQSAERMAVLLEKYPDSIITSEMLEHAVRNAGEEIFRLLVARATVDNITERVLSRAIASERLDHLELLLDKLGGIHITPNVLERAVSKFAGPNLYAIELLLERAVENPITEDVMVAVVKFASTQTLRLMLKHGGKVTQELLIGCRDPDKLEILLEYGCKINGKALRLAARDSTGDMLANVLDRANGMVLAEEMTDVLFEAAGSDEDASEKVMHLLGRVQDVKISEETLLAAACSWRSGNEVMRIFLDMERPPEITTEVLICATRDLDLNTVVQLLERVAIEGIMLELLEAAAANWISGGKLIRLLLRQTDIQKLPEAALERAIRNQYGGHEVIWALEETFGKINVTEDIMLKITQAARGSHILPPGGWDLFESGPITEQVLISAIGMSSEAYEREGRPVHTLRGIITEKALHLPVTIDILKAAARHADLNFFRFLWNRGSMAKAPEELVKEVASNERCPAQILEYLLDEAAIDEIGEEVTLAVVSNKRQRSSIFNLLPVRGLQPPVTYDVLKRAIAYTPFPGTDLWVVQWLLQRFAKTEITEELFHVAATAASESLIYLLSEHCDMESPPGKWLDLARLHRALAVEDLDTSRDLLTREATLAVARLDDSALLKSAFRRETILGFEMLLAAGVAPDGLIKEWSWINCSVEQVTPLWKAAEQGNLELVKLLVTAGASLDFKDSSGHTPYTIAKEERRVKVFKFLEQARKDREREAQSSGDVLT